MNNSTTFTLYQSSSTAPGITAFTQIAYSIIATVAFFGNILVISIFLRDRKLLKKSYNMLILSLAIADVLTAILLITNPAFVLGDAFPYPSNHVLANIFCRVIWSRVFLFQLVIFSAYICLALTIERWYAVIKPFRYGGIFNKKRTLAYIFSAWVWSLILCGSTFFEVLYVPSNAPTRRCKWQFFWGKQPVRAIVGIIQVLLKMALPSFSMLALYAHMLYKTSKSTSASAESRAKMRGKMTRMVGAACLVLIVFSTKSDQLRVGNGGKSADGHQTTPRPFSFGLHKQLCESVHLRAKQQKLPCRISKITVSEMQQGDTKHKKANEQKDSIRDR